MQNSEKIFYTACFGRDEELKFQKVESTLEKHPQKPVYTRRVPGI